MGKLSLKVVPSSSKDSIVGWHGKSLKIKVKAPPEKGKANAAVIALIAARIGIDKRWISIFSGELSSSKILEIDGLEDAQIVGAIDLAEGMLAPQAGS
jgi:uncharacterized protein